MINSAYSIIRRLAAALPFHAAILPDGPASDGSPFNKICFGYTTGQTLTESQLWFESSRRGETKPIMVDTGMDLYNEEYHTTTMEYESNRVAFYLDGKLLAEVTGKFFTPTDPMDLVLGPRLVTGREPLTRRFRRVNRLGGDLLLSSKQDAGRIEGNGNTKHYRTVYVKGGSVQAGYRDGYQIDFDPPSYPHALAKLRASFVTHGAGVNPRTAWKIKRYCNKGDIDQKPSAVLGGNNKYQAR
ncbi:hypothetical protein DL769_007537 [Monosporascus sp. CRB-8-3]|nr:hypothetical protein DL769_007537 [Monosporascus sp. CRB-8-3]